MACHEKIGPEQKVARGDHFLLAKNGLGASYRTRGPLFGGVNFSMTGPYHDILKGGGTEPQGVRGARRKRGRGGYTGMSSHTLLTKEV